VLALSREGASSVVAWRVGLQHAGGTGELQAPLLGQWTRIGHGWPMEHATSLSFLTPLLGRRLRPSADRVAARAHQLEVTTPPDRWVRHGRGNGWRWPDTPIRPFR
jgi:hypothetical protein